MGVKVHFYRLSWIQWVCLHRLASAFLLLFVLSGSTLFDPLLALGGSGQVPHASSGIAWDNPLMGWDAFHYLHLAREGYTPNHRSNAFYPLWPLLIRLGSFFTFGDLAASGWLLANLFSVLGAMAFYHLVARLRGEKVAFWAVAVWLAFPGAVFLTFIYTEPLFFLLSMVFFDGIYRKRPWQIVVAGLFLPMTRAVGIFCLAPLGWMLLRGRLPRCQWPLILAPLCGYAAYFGIMYAYTGNPFAGFEAQQHYPNKPSIANIFDIPAIWNAFLNVGQFHGLTDSALDRVLFLIFIACLPFIWRLDQSLFFYSVGVGLIPAMSNWFFSYTRFIMMCFPVFIILGIGISRLERGWLRWGVLAIFGILQFVLLRRFANFRWAG